MEKRFMRNTLKQQEERQTELELTITKQNEELDCLRGGLIADAETEKETGEVVRSTVTLVLIGLAFFQRFYLSLEFFYHRLLIINCILLGFQLFNQFGECHLQPCCPLL